MGGNLSSRLCDTINSGSVACSDSRTCGAGLFFCLLAEPLAHRGSPEVKISRHKMMYLPPQAPANTHFALVFSTKGRTALLCFRPLPGQRASKTSIVDRRIKKMSHDEPRKARGSNIGTRRKTNHNISNRRGRASISSLNRINAADATGALHRRTIIRYQDGEPLKEHGRSS